MNNCVMRLLKQSQVKMSGYLCRRHTANIDYLLKRHEEYGEFMLDAFRKRGLRNNEGQWDGEYAGKWMDAASKTAANTGSVTLLEKVDSFARILVNMQEDDGYMGTEDEEHKGKVTWDVWNQWYAITGWLTHYEQSGAEASLISAVKAGEWVVRNYGNPKDSNSHFFNAAHNGGCNAVITDQLARLYRHCGSELLLSFIRAVSENYSPVVKMRSSKRVLTEEPFQSKDAMTEHSLQNPKSNYMMHAYVLFAYLGGLTELACIDGKKDELQWLEAVWEDLVKNHLYPTGGYAFRERLREDSPNDTPDDDQQETCTTVEWMFFNRRMYLATANPRYISMLEKTTYNALLAAQSMDGMKWTYYTPLRYHKRWFSGPTKCCYWSGPRGIAMLPELVYAFDDNGLYINIFEESRAKFLCNGQEIVIEQHTDYPVSGKILAEFHMEKSAELALNIRIPEWVCQVDVSINGKREAVENQGTGYITLKRKWQDRDLVEAAFEIPTILSEMRSYGVTVARGAEIMSLDSRDNEQLQVDTKCMDKVVIPKGLELQPKGMAGGRRVYSGKVMVDGKLKEVFFTPYAEAGGDMACFRTVFPLYEAGEA